MRTPTFPITLTAGGLDPVTVDIASLLARLATEQRHRFSKIMGGADLYLREIQAALPGSYRIAAHSGPCSIQKSFHDELAQFAGANGLTENPRRLDDHFRAIRSLEWSIKEIAEALAAAENGRMTESPADTAMVCLPFGDRFAMEPEELTEDWGYEAFVESDPRPAFDDVQAMAAWEGRYDAWKTTSMLPFVYGTYPIYFDPLTAKALIQSYHEDDSESLARTAEHAIECEIDNHHEDAGDEIQGAETLMEELSHWETARTDAETGRLPDSIRPDAELEAIVKRFNDRQTLVSYKENRRALVPVRPGVTKEDCLAALRRRLDAEKQQLDALHGSWDPAAAAVA